MALQMQKARFSEKPQVCVYTSSAGLAIGMDASDKDADGSVGCS